MMHFPRCSNVGLGSMALMAHTRPLVIPRSAAILRAHLFDVILIVFEENLVLPQVFLHSFGFQGLQFRIPLDVVQTSHRTTEYQTIKTADYSPDLLFVFFDKLLHGVLLFGVGDLELQRHSTTKENAAHICDQFAAKPRCATNTSGLLAMVGQAVSPNTAYSVMQSRFGVG